MVVRQEDPNERGWDEKAVAAPRGHMEGREPSNSLADPGMAQAEGASLF